MSVTAYRRIRITVGALVLGFCLIAFADVSGWLPPAVIHSGLWFQFTPSLLASLQGLAWAVACVFFILLLTLLFGRVYCAMLCPLGVLMDLSAWIGRRTGKKRKLPYRKGHTRLRAAVVVICAVGLLAGSALPLAFLDPYSLFGKITSATIRPVVGEANHLLSSTGWFLPAKWSPVAPATFAVAMLLLLAIVLTAVLRGRLWCNTLCPVGAVLGLFSRHALFRLGINADACVACSVCERTCPSQCIDYKNTRIDHSRCVMCLSCVSSCRRNGIRLETKYTRSPLPVEPAAARTRASMTGINRRMFLAGATVLPGAAAVAAMTGDRTNGSTFKPRPVLPPGAGSLEHFQSRCTACHLCVTNCPEQVLRPSITAHGLAGFLQPYQDFNVSFCSYNCSNCSQVCPTGAIEAIRVEERRAVRTGTAHFFEDLCVVKTKGTPCGACNEHCPTQAVHMVPYENGLTIPEINEELCVGCGGCEYICPVRPHRAIVVDGLDIHERADPVDRGKENTVREIEEEFPF